MMKEVNVDYVTKAKNLSQEQRERVLSRMIGKLPKRLLKEKLTPEEAIAIQLELEDEQLQEWRKNMAEIQDKSSKAKLKAEEKAAAKAEKKAKSKKVEAEKPATKSKAAKPAAKKAETTPVKAVEKTSTQK
jgi:membrane protein involved in colicin uptake